jgi:hypothetical protein
MLAELTNHVWQSTLFAVAAGLVTVALRKNRAKVRFWLWFSASLKFFVPFSLLMSVGSHLQWAPATQQIAAPAVSLTMVQLAQPFSGTMPLAPSTRVTRDWVPMALLGVWASGFAGLALIRFRAWRSIRNTVRCSTPIGIPAALEVRESTTLLEPGVVGWLHPILLYRRNKLTRDVVLWCI